MKERREQIIEILKQKGKVSVAELARTLYVCEMTIRRDLKLLAGEGRIKRYNGGAMLFNKETDFPFNDRKLLHSKQKIALSKLAAQYVQDGNVIFIDSSSTCAYIVPQIIYKKNVKIVTNSITVSALAMQHNISCILLGGECLTNDMCTVGSFTTDTLEKINLDIAFLSSNAISSDGLITDNDILQTAVRKVAIKRAEHSIFIFTKPKQNKKEMYTLCTAKDVFKVILE